MALPISARRIYIQDNFEAAHSSSQRALMGSATLLLPVVDQNKQRPPDVLPRRALFFVHHPRDINTSFFSDHAHA